MRRFPLGLTLAAAVAFAILARLGFWQLDRLRETKANRQAIATLASKPASPLAALLAAPRLADHARAEFTCQPMTTPRITTYRYALPQGAIGWRLISMCRIAAAPYDGLLLDRGLVSRLAGTMTPAAYDFSPSVHVVGVLRKLGGKPMLGNAMNAGEAAAHTVRVIDAATVAKLAAQAGLLAPAPLYVVVESEAPSPAGVQPSPVTEDTPRDNFGYALTWFGLSLGLLGVWGAFVWRRLAGR